jgi:hypothetical protein
MGSSSDDVKDVNEIAADGLTPLMRAAHDGDLARVEALLAAGAEPLLRDSRDETALLKAAAGGHSRVYALLLPFADEEEKAFAKALFAAAPKGNVLPGGPPELAPDSKWPDRFARASAGASDLLGDASPAARLERVMKSRRLKK